MYGEPVKLIQNKVSEKDEIEKCANILGTTYKTITNNIAHWGWGHDDGGGCF